MTVKVLGAVLIILACGGFGLNLAASHKAQERSIKQLMAALEYMECDLRFHLTPLPELCIKAGQNTKGLISQIFCQLARDLDRHTQQDVAACMRSIVENSAAQGNIRELLLSFSKVLGRFDLEGQLKGIASVHSACERALEQLTNNRDMRLRSYQTLGLCAGAALVILFI